MVASPEQSRLLENQAGKANWQRWGPYLSERAWGTVREDYSANGDAWNYFPHDHARSRVIVGEMVPGIARRTIILSHGAPLSLGKVRSPPTPVLLAAIGQLQRRPELSGGVTIVSPNTRKMLVPVPSQT